MKIGINLLAIPVEMAGTGIYASNLLHNLFEEDCENRYTIFMNEKSVERFGFDFPNVTVVPFKVRNLIQRVFLEQVVLPFRTIKLDLLHSVSNVLPLLSACKTVVTIHDIYQVYYPERFPFLKLMYLKFFVPLTVLKADKIITVSQCSKNDIEKSYAKFSNSNKINVTLEASRYVERKPSIDKNYLLFVGTLEPGKNLNTLLKAYHKLDDEIKRNYPLKIIGGRGWKNSSIAATISDLKLEKFVHFLGYISDEELADEYYGASLFILPSLYEGFGLPVLEAMSQGTAVITSNVSSLPEVAGTAAKLVDPQSIEELSKAMNDILSSSKTRDEMVENGYKNNSNFSWKQCALDTITIYKNS
jgi:glycosyltransferase involved in cell wall biosynthesis